MDLHAEGKSSLVGRGREARWELAAIGNVQKAQEEISGLVPGQESVMNVLSQGSK